MTHIGTLLRAVRVTKMDLSTRKYKCFVVEQVSCIKCGVCVYVHF